MDQAAGGAINYHTLRQTFTGAVEFYMRSHVIDNYIMCFSEHDVDDHDGRLSMWRAYSANGNGAAIVFDSAKFMQIDGAPFVLAKVHYATYADREVWMRNKIGHFADILRIAHMDSS